MNSRGRLLLIFLMATIVGAASGLFGVGGGVLLVPLLVVVLGFDQHVCAGDEPGRVGAADGLACVPQLCVRGKGGLDRWLVDHAWRFLERDGRCSLCRKAFLPQFAPNHRKHRLRDWRVGGLNGVATGAA
jgi:hypothetical protein